MKKYIGLSVAVSGLLLGFSSAFAGTATWLTNPGSGDWNTAGNWTQGGPPNMPADTATFNSSAVTSLWLSGSTQISGITFNSGAGISYTINVSSLGIIGSGITNNSGTTQNFIPGADREILFANSASAGFNTTFTMGGNFGDGSTTYFFDGSTAGNAAFTAHGSNRSDRLGGGVVFYANSKGGSATIIANGSAFRDYPPGYILFADNSTAGNATLLVNGGMGDGNGGVIAFQQTSTGGTARVQLFGNGVLNISDHDLGSPGLTIGSLEGNGLVYLGRFILTVGSNNLNTNFSGLLRNGSGIVGESAMGSLTKFGTGTLILSGANTFTGPTTINAGKLKVDGSITSAVTVNNGGTLAGSGTTRSVTVNSGGMVAPGGSQTLHVNGNYAQNAGGVLKIDVAGADPNASGRVDITGGATVDGTLEVRFVNGLLPVSGQVIKVLEVDGAFAGSFAQIIFPDLRAGFQFQPEFVNGSYQLTALNDGLAASGFLNISTRMRVGTGDSALIGGFIVAGNASKKVIIRAIGPSLAPLPGRLADPTLELRDSAGGLIFSNDNWMESPQAQEIMDTIPPVDQHEAAIVATLAPGSYTAVMRGVNNTTGIGVVELYDLAQEIPARLANISSRGFVETDDDVMIGGFIAGNQASPVMVRAIGPSLTPFGIPNALADPTLSLHNGDGAMIGFNNDWQDSSDQVAIAATGIPPGNDQESAIIATLPPGNYTAIVRGLNATTGVGLVEAYDLH